jgi:hypothetical protein
MTSRFCQAAWLIEELQATNTPGTTIGGYIKALKTQAQGGAKEYAKFAVIDLPENASTQSIRHGTINTMDAVMPTTQGAHASGHDLTSKSAFFEYVETTRSDCMPGEPQP